MKTERLGFFRSIRGQLLLFFLAVALVPLLITGLWLYDQANEALREEAINKLVVVRDTKAQQVAGYLGQSRVDVNSYAQDKFSVTMMRRFSDAVMSLVRLHDVEPVEAMAKFRDQYLGQPEVEMGDPGVTYSVVHSRFHSGMQSTIETQGVEDILLVEPSGTVVYSVNKDPKFGSDLGAEPYAGTSLYRAFEAAVTSESPDFVILSDVSFYGPSGEPGLFVASPVMEHVGTEGAEVTGVVIFELSLARVNEIMNEQAGLGETGETYLVGEDGLMRSDSRLSAENNVLRQEVDTDAVERALAGQSGFEVETDHRGEPVLAAYKPLEVQDVQWAVVSQIDQDEAFALSRQVLTMTLIAMGLATVVVAAVAFVISRRMIGPLTEMTQVARNVAGVELPETSEAMLSARDSLASSLAIPPDAVDVRASNEIGQMARSFVDMAGKLRRLLDQLVGEEELRQAKETAEAASRAMEASAEVSHAAASILEPDQLMAQVVELIRERFGLYYVGLFLVDGASRWAILQAGTGEAGQAMLARGHRIRLGEGMIGWSIAHAQARVASQAEADTMRLTTPELPDTRSEAALPLRSRGQVIGALTVQSTEPGTFDSRTISVLQVMADQVAVALDNARLYVESQEALEAVRRAYGEVSRGAWAELLHTQAGLGFVRNRQGLAPVDDAEGVQVERAAGYDDGRATMAIPLKVGDSVIGVVDARREGKAGWSTEDVALVESLAEQLALALESARLYQDSQRRAAEEQLLGEVTARMRETLDLDAVLRTAIREIGDALGIAEVEVRLREGGPDGDGHGRTGEVHP